EVPLRAAFPPTLRTTPLLVEDGLDLEDDLDAVADDDAAGLEHGVEVDAEVAALDLAGGGEAAARPAEGIRPEAARLQVERDRLRDALERQLAVQQVVVTVGPDASGAEVHRLVLLGVEEVGGAQVVVAVGVARSDRGQ